MTNKRILAILLILSFWVVLFSPALTFAGECDTILLNGFCSGGQFDLGGFIRFIINILTTGVIVAGTIGIIICGRKIVTAADNQEVISHAKKRIFEIVIGLVLWVVGTAIAGFLIPGFSGTLDNPGMDIPTVSVDHPDYSELKFPDKKQVGGGGSGDDGGDDGGSDPMPTRTYPAQSGLQTLNGMPYWLTVPDGSTDKMPLIVFLHGSGELGDSTSVSYTMQAQKMAAYAKSKKFISIVPVASTWGWENGGQTGQVKAIIDKVAADYDVNKNKIYVWGFSMGGRGTFHMVSSYPGFFKAAIVVSNCMAGGDSASNIAKTSIRMILGSADGDYSYYYNCMMTAKSSVSAAGGSITYEELPGATHSGTSGALDYDSIFNWLLSH